MVKTGDRLCKYNMTVDFWRKHFSGLLLIRQTEAGTYRTLFSTHFGLSLFDLEINRDRVVVHHCIESLNKKKILDLLARDFSVLFGLFIQPENQVIPYQCLSTQNEAVYYITYPIAKGFYRQDKATGRLEEIRMGSGLRKITFRSLPDSSGNTPSIQIRHTGLRLTIGLDALQ